MNEKLRHAVFTQTTVTLTHEEAEKLLVDRERAERLVQRLNALLTSTPAFCICEGVERAVEIYEGRRL